MKKVDYKPFLFFSIYAIVLVFPSIGCFNLFDWDEINFAESSREMIISNNFFQVMINFEPFHEKPPLYFWLQVISMKIFGISSFSARLPNAVLSVIFPVILFNIGSRLKNKTFGWIWALIFLSGLLPNLYFRTGIIDPYFNLFIFLSIYFFYLSITNNKIKNIFFSGLFSGLAILAKGPVGLLLVLLSCSIYFLTSRKKISLKNILIFIFTVIIVSSPWYILELINKGPWFLIEFIQYQIELFSKPVAGHQQPVFYHFVIVLFGCIPFSFFALRNIFIDSKSDLKFEKMMRICFWTVLVLFTIVTTKIVHYSSMAYIPLSFLGSIEFYKIIKGKRFNKVLKLLLFLLSSIIAIVLSLFIYLLIYKKEIIMSFSDDNQFKTLLNLNLSWQGWEWTIPLIIAFSSLLWIIKFKFHLLKCLAIYSLLIGLSFSLISYFIIPNVEFAIQGTAVSFYKDISKEKKYLTTVGFKSYAPYFYSEVDHLKKVDKLYQKKSEILKKYFSANSLNDLNRLQKNKFNGYVLSWLINGDVDRTVYFVSKKSKPILLLQNAKNLELIKDQAGYQFYKRKLK
ncbi:MAG: ArnT family glycosyltransferase [Parvicellaceae bacterium]